MKMRTFPRDFMLMTSFGPIQVVFDSQVKAMLGKKKHSLSLPPPTNMLSLSNLHHKVIRFPK